MSSNTPALDDGKYVTTSSISVTGASRMTVKTQDLVASLISTNATGGGGGLLADYIVTRGGAAAFNQLQAGSTGTGSAILPVLAIGSDTSLGLFASAVSTIGVTYGKFDFRNAGLIMSSGTTAQSASTTKVTDGQLIFSVLSLTTNGAALYFRSGNSTYVWPSSGVIG